MSTPSVVRGKKKSPPPISGLRGKKLIPFGWYGGKFSHIDWLLPLLPDCHHYCEPFAGSAAVLLNRAPSPVETYNDLDGEVVNFFRVCREEGDALTKAIALTPFSREEFAIACTLDPEQSALERARRFYVRARQVRTGLAQTATLGRWGNCKNTSRAGMSGIISRFMGGVEMMPEIAMRLLRVQIENRPAIDIQPVLDILLPGHESELAALRPDPGIATRIEELTRKSNEGELSPDEHTEYQGYVRANKFVAILQRQARRVLNSSP